MLSLLNIVTKILWRGGGGGGGGTRILYKTLHCVPGTVTVKRFTYYNKILHTLYQIIILGS